MSISVMLVDDQDLIRAGFSMILAVEDDIDVVAEASDGHRAVELAQSLRPDVILMDVQMPDMDGIEATEAITGAGSSGSSKVVILTTFDRDDYLYQSLRAGASGFLLKNSEPDELVRAIRRVADGHALLAPQVTRRVIERFSASSPPVDDAVLDRLTERERDVLVQVARGLSNAEIASALYLGEATVKTHVSRVLMKLELRDRVQAVVVAYETGLVSPPRG